MSGCLQRLAPYYRSAEFEANHVRLLVVQGFDRHVGTSVQLTVLILFVAGYVIARDAGVEVVRWSLHPKLRGFSFVDLPYQRTLIHQFCHSFVKSR